MWISIKFQNTELILLLLSIKQEVVDHHLTSHHHIVIVNHIEVPTGDLEEEEEATIGGTGNTLYNMLNHKTNACLYTV